MRVEERVEESVVESVVEIFFYTLLLLLAVILMGSWGVILLLKEKIKGYDNKIDSVVFVDEKI